MKIASSGNFMKSAVVEWFKLIFYLLSQRKQIKSKIEISNEETHILHNRPRIQYILNDYVEATSIVSASTDSTSESRQSKYVELNVKNSHVT